MDRDKLHIEKTSSPSQKEVRNTAFLYRELQWLQGFMMQRLRPDAHTPISQDSREEFSVNDHNGGVILPLYNLKLSEAERCVHALALAPHVLPNFLDDVLRNGLKKEGDFPQLGGARSNPFRGFLPTGETAVFFIGGDDLEQRFELQKLFSEQHFFHQRNILNLEEIPPGAPRMSGKILLSQDYLDLLTLGRLTEPKFGINFPAQRISTPLCWDDLILSPITKNQIHEIQNWILHGDTLLYDWGLEGRVKPGYRVLFYGPPGTGKTMAATLLGKYTEREVYKIDLSMVVSKYIGETEKNLANLFAIAENRNWILFFDEADAIFGKRTDVHDAHDKYANQEVSYLLQRIESYNGLVILASNFKNNIDEAFVRRFQAVIYFPLPKKEERIRLWQLSLPMQLKKKIAKNVDLNLLAHRFEVTGANVVNIVQQLCLEHLAKGSAEISNEDFETAILKEFSKENKML